MYRVGEKPRQFIVFRMQLDRSLSVLLAHKISNETKSRSAPSNNKNSFNNPATNMKVLTISIVATLLGTATAFAFTAPRHSDVASSTVLNVYVPDGLTPEQYRRIRAQDQKKMGKDLGRLGPRGFKSQSMQAWQEAYEKGLATHSFAPFGYREAAKSGKIKKEDIPYMVRGGSWDNSDIFGAKRLIWLNKDKEYARGGYKREQSV
jgi:hypothetical protein